MKFVLEGSAVFEAEEIDDALEKLGNHFLALSKDGLDGSDIFTSATDISVHPLKEEAPMSRDARAVDDPAESSLIKRILSMKSLGDEARLCGFDELIESLEAGRGIDDLASMTAGSQKEEKIIDLVHKYFFAKEKYKALGMVNTFGQTPEFRKQLDEDYALAINEMAERRQAINEELLKE